MGIFSWIRRKDKEDKEEEKRRLARERGEVVSAAHTQSEAAIGGDESKKRYEAAEKRTEESEKEIKRQRVYDSVTHEYVPVIYKKFCSLLQDPLLKDKMPHIIIDDSIGTSYSNESTIGIHSSHVGDPSLWGEEVSHYLRKQLRNDVGDEEHHSAEFFGYLGRRLTSKFLGKEYHPDEVTQKLLDRNEVREVLNSNRHQANLEIKDRVNKFISSGDSSIVTERGQISTKVSETRNDALIHHRPYSFASKVDLSKIHDWKKLFSMPDKEVRRRFFRPDPDYSGL